MRHLILLLVNLIIVFSVRGQVIFGPEIGLGINRTTYADPSSPAGPTTSVTPVAGLSAWSAFPGRINVMAGIRYLKTENNLSGESDNGIVYRKSDNQYITIPARITFSVLKYQTRNSVHLYIGPELSYWASSRITIRNADNRSILLNKHFDFRSHSEDNSFINRIQFGFQAGATLLMQRGKSNWAVSLQYAHGLSKQTFSDIRYSSVPGFRDDLGFRNQTFMITGTYFLDFRSKKQGRTPNKHLRPNWRSDL